MAKVGWRFKGGRRFYYEKQEYEQLVRNLIYRIKPIQTRVLTIDFSFRSESAYIALVPDKSCEYYMFRISSHPSFSQGNYLTFDTTKMDSFVGLEKQLKDSIQTAVNNRKVDSKLRFQFEREEYFFFRFFTFLTHEKQFQLFMETELFREQGAWGKVPRALVVDSEMKIKGTLKDNDLSLALKSAITKGYLNVNIIDKKYSTLMITPLFRSLFNYFSSQYERECQEIDLESYFDQVIEMTDEKVHVERLWPFRNHYYLRDFKKTLLTKIKTLPLSNFELFSCEVNEDSQLMILSFIVKESKGSFIRMIISSKPSQAQNSWITTEFRDFNTLGKSISRHLNKLDSANEYGYEDFLLHQLIYQFTQTHRRLLIPQDLINNQRYSINKHLVYEPGNLERLTVSVKRALALGLISQDEKVDQYIRVVTTPLGKKLFQQAKTFYEFQFLNDLKEDSLPESYKLAYKATPYGLRIQQQNKTITTLEQIEMKKKKAFLINFFKKFRFK